MPLGFAPALSRPSRSPATAQVVRDLIAEALLDRDRAARETAREEGRDQVVHVEFGRVDRSLQVEAERNMAEERVQRPLLLLIAAGRPPREARRAVVAEREPGA